MNTIQKSKTNKNSKVLTVKNTLKSLAFEEVSMTPAFKVTFIGRCKPKIVRTKSDSEISTDAEDETTMLSHTFNNKMNL